MKKTRLDWKTGFLCYRDEWCAADPARANAKNWEKEPFCIKGFLHWCKDPDRANEKYVTYQQAKAAFNTYSASVDPQARAEADARIAAEYRRLEREVADRKRLEGAGLVRLNVNGKWKDISKESVAAVLNFLMGSKAHTRTAADCETVDAPVGPPDFEDSPDDELRDVFESIARTAKLGDAFRDALLKHGVGPVMEWHKNVRDR